MKSRHILLATILIVASVAPSFAESAVEPDDRACLDWSDLKWAELFKPVPRIRPARFQASSLKIDELPAPKRKASKPAESGFDVDNFWVVGF